MLGVDPIAGVIVEVNEDAPRLHLGPATPHEHEARALTRYESGRLDLVADQLRSAAEHRSDGNHIGRNRRE